MVLTNRLFGIASTFLLSSLLLLSLNRAGVAKSPPIEKSTAMTQCGIDPADVSDAEKERLQRINYFGIGGTLGLSDNGETELGNGGFSIMSRTSFTDVLSLHTASVVGSNSFSSFALTGSFPVGIRDPEQRGRPAVIPFAGAGIGVEFEDFDVDPMATIGVDIPIANGVTGTARVNANFGEEGTDIGLVLGVGIRLFR